VARGAPGGRHGFAITSDRLGAGRHARLSSRDTKTTPAASRNCSARARKRAARCKGLRCSRATSPLISMMQGRLRSSERSPGAGGSPRL
jgi:hypothetical protein